MDEGGERTLNLKIVNALAEIKDQMSASYNDENNNTAYVKWL